MSSSTGFTPLHTPRPAPPAPGGPATGEVATEPVDARVFVNDFTRPLPDPAVTFSGPGYLTPSAPTSGFATAALILSLTGVFIAVPALLGIIFGHLGVHATRDNRRIGRGMAMGGMILGYAATLFWTVLISTTWLTGL